LITFTITHNN